MSSYRNCSCSSCHQDFKEHDDIVVCPDCGAPYHRACYTKEGACVFTSKHAEGFTFVLPEEQTAGAACPSCHHENSADNIFCERCGHALKEPAASSAPLFDAETFSFGGQTYELPKPATEYDGIDASLWKTYIGNSAMFYFQIFSQMDIRKRKARMCWSAFFFPPMYFFYRRMWGWGILSLLLFAGLSVPYALYLFQVAGLQFGISAGLVQIFSYLSIAAQFIFSFFAFYLYRQHAANKLKKMQKNYTEPAALQAAVSRVSGPSLFAVILMFATPFVLGLILPIL